MKRRTLLAAPLLATLPLAYPVARAAAPEVQPVEALDQALIRVMKAGSSGKTFTERYQMLEPVIEKSFNLEQILQNSAGLLWSQIPAGQQSKLEKLFREYTVATYISNFNTYGGQHFTVSPNIRSTGDARIVATDLVSSSGKKTRLSYVMRQSKGNWQITDVLFEGTISKVATQRSDFSGLIEPGNAQKLIDALTKKVTALSNGALKG